MSQDGAASEWGKQGRLLVPGAVELFEGEAEANAVVVAEILAGEGAKTSLRTVQRAL